MKNILFISLISTLTFLGGYFLAVKLTSVSENNIIVRRKAIERPLDKYTIENLSTANIKTADFQETIKLNIQDDFISYLFHYGFYPALDDKLKTTTGVINRPTKNDNTLLPLVILIRGYVDQKNYTSGIGSKNIGEYLANNGFITIAPDFLGYADSDSEAGNIFESRFQTYVTIVSLMKYIEENGISGWDGKNIFIWAHSNGGQIALTSLEITGSEYPTVLWAPVSKPFPYSVLYYTDESADHGKLIRTELSKFETLYDVEKYSLTNYLEKINAPIQLHQGTADDAVPISWSNSLYLNLKNLDKKIDYHKYSGANHNFVPDWNNAAMESLRYFTSFMID